MTGPLRIAYLLPDPGIPVGGTKGASVHVNEVCRALMAEGASITLLAQRTAGHGPDGVEIIELDPGPVARGRSGEPARVSGGVDFARRAAPVLEALRPNLVYERLALFFDAGGRLARAVGAARLLEVNAPVVQERERTTGLLERALADHRERRALAGASVLAVSPSLAAWAMARGAARAEVVPNGVDLERFEPGRNRAAAAELRRSLGLAETAVVGFTGSLKPWHGVEVLVAAIAILAPSRPDLRLLVVGDGPGRAELTGQVAALGLADRVVFAGAVPPAMVPTHLAAIDIAVAPYLPMDDFYFSPLKVVEAMAAGRPIVASRFGSIEAMLAGTGRLVPPGDPTSLAAALAGLLDDPPEAGRLGAAARGRAEAAHGWDRVARRILAMSSSAGRNVDDGLGRAGPVANAPVVSRS